jgi:hypothetical protein
LRGFLVLALAAFALWALGLRLLLARRRRVNRNFQPDQLFDIQSSTISVRCGGSSALVSAPGQSASAKRVAPEPVTECR